MRADLCRYYGVDLLDVFRGKMTADACWDLLVHLPRDSALMSALAADPEFASGKEPGPPPMSDFGPQVEVLAALHDRMGTLLTMLGVEGLKPWPRPQTAGEVQRAAERRRRHDALITRIFGKG